MVRIIFFNFFHLMSCIRWLKAPRQVRKDVLCRNATAAP